MTPRPERKRPPTPSLKTAEEIGNLRFEGRKSAPETQAKNYLAQRMPPAICGWVISRRALAFRLGICRRRITDPVPGLFLFRVGPLTDGPGEGLSELQSWPQEMRLILRLQQTSKLLRQQFGQDLWLGLGKRRQPDRLAHRLKPRNQRQDQRRPFGPVIA